MVHWLAVSNIERFFGNLARDENDPEMILHMAKAHKLLVGALEHEFYFPFHIWDVTHVTNRHAPMS
jgi:hypothetical protein